MSDQTTPMQTITFQPEGKTYEIVDAQARQQLQQIIAGLPTVDEQMREAFTNVQNDITELQNDMATATNPKNLYGLEDARAASANLPAQGTNSLQYLIATSTMTTGKPPIGDCKILNMEWDNTGGWTSQLAIGHPANMNASNAMAIRRMSSGNWNAWQTLLDLLYPVGSVYISSTNTNPASILGGTWSLIHKGFAYQIIENPVTYNTTNTASGVSTAVLNGQTLQLRMTFAPKVDFADSTITIGQLNLDQIGLTGKYAEMFPYINDGGNGIGMLNISNTGAITINDVVAKGTGTTIPVSTSTGQVRGTLMFGQSSMIDSFCDEFHWKRTA